LRLQVVRKAGAHWCAREAAAPSATDAETKAVCTDAGMFALRERRVHVT
jgi:ATP-dependent 26S proteasome regulatory subunit